MADEMFESDVEDFEFDDFDEGDLGSQDFDSDDWVDSELEEEFDKVAEADMPHKESFRCTVCEKSYKTNGWLLRHVRNKHGSIQEESSQFTSHVNTEEPLEDASKVYSLSRTAAEKRALELFEDSLNEAINFKPFCVKLKSPTRGNKARDLAIAIKEKLKEETVVLFASESIKMMWKSVTAGDNCKTLCNNREEIMRSFHNFRITQELKDRWDKMIRLLGMQNPDNMLFQFIIDRMFRNLVVKRELSSKQSSEKCNVPAETDDVKLDILEENALRYVAGYIPFALKRRVENSSCNNKKAILACIDTWKSMGMDNRNTKTFLDYTKKWTNAVNRGGLFTVNDIFYIFIRRVENIVRKFFSNEFLLSYKGGSIKSCVLTKLVSDKLILSGWADLTVNKDLPDSVSSVLFKRILEHYVQIRAKAFVVVWLQVQKNKRRLKHAKKGEKGLRKGLQRKNEE